MFDFIFQNKNGELKSLVDLISINLDKIHLSDLAQEKAMSMISKAIAKSEIVLLDKQHNQRFDHQYFQLNVQPNDNQTGTDFWYQAAMELLHTGDCLIVMVNGKYYIAQYYTASNTVLYGKSYSNVSVWDGIDSYRLDRSFTEAEVVHLRYGTDQLRMWTRNVLKLYNDTISAIRQAETISNTPLFKYKINGSRPIYKTLDENGNEITVTSDYVIDKLKKKITDGGLVIIPEGAEANLSYLKIDSNASVGDMHTMAAEINEQCAKAFDIPLGVFNGQITENSDATNEFITYAVQPIAEIITDSLNAKLVGEADYVNGERAIVWLAKFKHRDVLDNADKIDKLRADGFSLDECRDLAGMWTLDTDFSKSRVITKNYSTEGTGKGAADAPDDGSDELSGDQQVTQTEQKNVSKHKERRIKREKRS